MLMLNSLQLKCVRPREHSSTLLLFKRVMRRISLYLKLGSMNVSASIIRSAFSEDRFVVPTIQPDIDRNAPTSALALVLCGNVAIEKLALFSPR